MQKIVSLFFVRAIIWRRRNLYLFVSILDFRFANQIYLELIWLSAPKVFMIGSRVICNDEHTFWEFGVCSFISEGVVTCSRHKKFLLFSSSPSPVYWWVLCIVYFTFPWFFRVSLLRCYILTEYQERLIFGWVDT